MCVGDRLKISDNRLFLEVFGEEISEEDHVLHYVTENISDTLSSFNT